MTQNSFLHNIQEENKSLFVIRAASILAERAPAPGFLTRHTKLIATWARLAPPPSTGTHSSHPCGQVGTTRVCSAHRHKHRGANPNDTGGRVKVWHEGTETRQF